MNSVTINGVCPRVTDRVVPVIITVEESSTPRTLTMTT